MFLFACLESIYYICLYSLSEYTLSRVRIFFLFFLYLIHLLISVPGAKCVWIKAQPPIWKFFFFFFLKKWNLMQGKEYCSMTQNTLLSNININSRKISVKLICSMILEEKQDFFQYNEKDLLFTINFENWHKQTLIQNQYKESKLHRLEWHKSIVVAEG